MGNNTKLQEDLHVAYISAICAATGISYDTQKHDEDSTDGILKKQIYLDNGNKFFASLRIQLKSTASKSQYREEDDCIKYNLKAKNYNDLCARATTPIILGLLILPEDKSGWVEWTEEELLIRGKMYWANFSGCKKTNNEKSVIIKIDKKDVINLDTLNEILLKQAKEEL